MVDGVELVCSGWLGVVGTLVVVLCRSVSTNESKKQSFSKVVSGIDGVRSEGEGSGVVEEGTLLLVGIIWVGVGKLLCRKVSTNEMSGVNIDENIFVLFSRVCCPSERNMQWRWAS